MHKYLNYWQKHQNVAHFLSILLLCGMICGILLSQWIDASIVSSLSNTAFSTILSDIDRTQFFISQFTTNITLALVVLFFGFSILGMPFIAFVIFTKGVQIGFSCAMYLITYHLKGMLGILFTLIPQVLFDAIAIFIISMLSFELSFELFKRCFINTKAIEWKKVFEEKINGILFSFALILLSSLLKATVVVFLMKIFTLIQ